MNASEEILQHQEQDCGRLRFFWIAFATAWITIYYSLRTIMASFFANSARSRIDVYTRNWSRSLLNLIGAKVVVSGNLGAQIIPGRPVIIMCNHASLYDIPASFLAVDGSLRMLAKKELFRIPIFSRALRRGEFLSIDRQNRLQAIKDLRRAKLKMEDGVILWVAPEGTRSDGSRLLPFKRGGFHLAIQTGALIVPMALKDIHLVQPGDELKLKLNRSINVEIGKAIDATQFSLEQRNQLVEEVRQQMASMLDLPPTSD